MIPVHIPLFSPILSSHACLNYRDSANWNSALRTGRGVPLVQFPMCVYLRANDSYNVIIMKVWKNEERIHYLLVTAAVVGVAFSFFREADRWYANVSIMCGLQYSCGTSHSVGRAEVQISVHYCKPLQWLCWTWTKSHCRVAARRDVVLKISSCVGFRSRA